MTDIWTRLKSHRQAQGETRITDLFDADPARARAFATQADGLVFDWSKTMIDADARDLLVELAEGADVAGRREAMFAGEHVNITEDRPVEHTAERGEGNKDSVARAGAYHARMRAVIDAEHTAQQRKNFPVLASRR